MGNDVSVYLTPEGELYSRLDKETFDAQSIRGPFGWLRIIEGLLKSRGGIYRHLMEGRCVGAYLMSMLVLSILGTALYGAVMGLFGGELQMAYAAAKLPIIVVGSYALCLPNFYIFNALCGSRLTFGRSAMLLLCLVAPLSIILLAFLPISLFFTLSSGSAAFISGLHVVVIAVALGFGLASVSTLRSYVAFLAGEPESAHPHYLKVWVFIYVFVCCQMAYYFKPLLAPGPFHTGERGIFFEFLKNLL